MTKRPFYHDLLRPENDHGPEALETARFLSRPIPTKPRRKAKAKRKGKARGMVTGWAFSWRNITRTLYRNNYTYSGVTAVSTRILANQRWHQLTGDGYLCGPITRIQLPAPAGKGGGE